MQKEMILLSVEEQQEVMGGTNWGCFASGALITVGVLTLQPEVVGGGLVAAATTCQ